MNQTFNEVKSEHILVCLSTSPSNSKIVETAAKMALAFGGAFTALYVKTPSSDKMSEEDVSRLQYHIQLAQQLGATVTTVYGEDVSYQIAEFARLSRVTKIVIGRSSVKRRHFWNKPTLTEKLTSIVPDLDIHIIPDYAAEIKYTKSKGVFIDNMAPSVKDVAVMLLMLAISTGIGLLFWKFSFTEANIITVYILGVLLTALFAKSYVCDVIAALASVVIFNVLFVEPRFTMRVNDVGAYFTFAIMLVASLITGTLANRLTHNAKQSAQSAYRTKVLFDTNQLLQKQSSPQDALNVVASQLMRLLERDVVTYLVTDGVLNEGKTFVYAHGQQSALSCEQEIAQSALQNATPTGATTENCSDAKGTYYPVAINGKVYGVIGILTDNKPLDSLLNGIVQSVLGECALAIDNLRNAEDKEKVALLAKQEQLRANLLRSISHDIRTPLTSISGNADYLLASFDRLDEATLKQVFTDIYDDSVWLTSLVENLLSVTRIEEGKINLNFSCEMVEDIFEEALRHVNRRGGNYTISVDLQDRLLMAKVDVKLILQVIINLVDNAIKHNSKNASIVLSACRQGNMVRFAVSDDGEGVPDELKERVFDMFFTGDNKVVDGRRSLGLGLALCKSIVNAHGGEICLLNNQPHGSIFTFTTPLGEVSVNE